MNQLNAFFDAQIAQKPTVAHEAASLLTVWRKVERTHLPVSFGCSCGGMGHVRVQDFEQDVLDYLREKHSENATVLALIARFTGPDNQDTQIANLLQGIRDDSDADSEVKMLLIADLRRSISSWSGALGPR